MQAAFLRMGNTAGNKLTWLYRGAPCRFRGVQPSLTRCENYPCQYLDPLVLSMEMTFGRRLPSRLAVRDLLPSRQCLESPNRLVG